MAAKKSTKSTASVAPTVADKSTAAAGWTMGAARAAANAPVTRDFTKAAAMGLGATLGYVAGMSLYKAIAS